MSSTIIRYDGSLDGFFSAVFAIYANRYDAVNLSVNLENDLFARTVEVSTHPEHANRVLNKLHERFGEAGMSHLLKAFLHTDADKDNVLLAVIRYALAHDTPDPLGDFSVSAVLKLAQYVKQIHREIHRMHAFVRFELAADGVYCAGIAPDFDLLPLIVPFFKRRYRDQRFLIADLARGYGAYYDLQSVKPVPISLEDWRKRKQHYAEGEAFYQSLWQNYFQAINISERRNIKLHKQYLPARYWKYLVEKNAHWQP